MTGHDSIDASPNQGGTDAGGGPRPTPGERIDSPADSRVGKVVVVTGLSGAGKSHALKSLEDLGYEAVDNLPLSLLAALIRPGALARPLAIGIDIRTRDFAVSAMAAEMDRLMQESHVDLSLLFVVADDDVLCRRFTETRRRHPLAPDRPLLDGIRHERELVSPLEERADLVIDTSALPPAELKRLLAGHFGLDRKPSLAVFVTSFSYRQGLPREADLVFDARFLDNPHYVAALRPLTGLDAPVVRHVEGDPGFPQFFTALTALLDPLLPRFAAEGKSYLTIAIGCTGGRHRSVVIAEKLAGWLRERDQQVELRHRELEEGKAK
ncbi:RNase adapter RapZ [Telmatospirillum siberiense]|uniref:RNase adapter RapZ n=1 Tax=Telmatospirillum siberiense TaxID=382514 RepID=A0A2N3PM74_9PROT|nr:RNase adapter RapZ [Telmatospirillum siberiense]PKU21496.1 RNase adapter RapZ [Telmatospirillum siberiense]